ncbi:MAG: hypothetical protein XD93_0403 [candidate division WS6 bacterium 34_10]|uniref:Uncharacterized protein n=1 Tax=candidate division WS6 bacterium 34_10 TaxID=1641389 RepID=A0A124FX93_9BACT|nr:MAG: hypothetical protein XD93_0403 [candidate division WS6 bacterium 34_10]
MVEQDNRDNPIIPGEIKEHELDWDQEHFESFLDIENVEFSDWSNHPENLYLSPLVTILDKENIFEIDKTIDNKIVTNKVFAYLIKYSEDTNEDRLVLINWQARKGKVVTYSVNPEEAADFCERYWDNERALFKERRELDK